MSDETEKPEEEAVDATAEAPEEEAQASEDSIDGEDSGSAEGLSLEDMNEEGVNTDEDDEFGIGEPMARDVEAIYDIPVQISAVLGRSTMQVSQLLKLGRGAVVELDRKVGEAIDIYVNNRLVARGEVVVVDDKLGVTMTEIVKTDRA